MLTILGLNFFDVVAFLFLDAAFFLYSGLSSRGNLSQSRSRGACVVLS